MDRQLDTYRVMLETLAESDELRTNRIDDFHALAVRVAQRHGAVFISDGKQIFNTLRPASAALPTLFDDPRVAPAGHDRPPVGDAHNFVWVSQVVSNLLDNAVKYTPPGGRITIELERAGQQSMLCVADNGRGLGASAAADLHAPFTAAPDAAAQGDGGLGLGLPLAKSLVELHGGSLPAYTKGANRGSRFTVRLPLAEAGAADEALSDARNERAYTPRRVLVVDDNIDAARMLGMVLESQGHETAVEHDGWAALRKAQGFGPAVLERVVNG
ncbi:MAG TPA: ATP-binding protein [Burkholderiales bacterium]|nr:ATP-binding protein [Burkholderiales bacterium]